MSILPYKLFQWGNLVMQTLNLSQGVNSLLFDYFLQKKCIKMRTFCARVGGSAFLSPSSGNGINYWNAALVHLSIYWHFQKFCNANCFVKGISRFHKIDHSGSAAKIVLEQKKFSKKLRVTGIDPVSGTPAVLLQSHAFPSLLIHIAGKTDTLKSCSIDFS